MNVERYATASIYDDVTQQDEEKVSVYDTCVTPVSDDVHSTVRDFRGQSDWFSSYEQPQVDDCCPSLTGVGIRDRDCLSLENHHSLSDHNYSSSLSSSHSNSVTSQPQLYHCPFCEKTFTAITSLCWHLSIHGQRQRLYICGLFQRLLLETKSWLSPKNSSSGLKHL